MRTGWMARLALLVGCAMAASCAAPPRGIERVEAAVVPESSTEQGTAPETVGRGKLWTGSVRFVGFSEQDLDEIRVIPEQTPVLFRPENASYRGVDGFWWKPDRTHWFKIPGHCEVVVWPPGHQGETPRARGADEEILSQGDRPRTWLRCKPWLTRILRSQGRVHKAGWYPNAGPSSIGAAYPF